MATLDTVRRKLQACGQGHVLRFYEELSPAERSVLLEQIEGIDLDALGGLIERYVLGGQPALETDGLEAPRIVPARPSGAADARERQAARQRGLKLVADGKVAAFVVAGGQGTRLGFDGPKGCLPATPVTHKSLFQLLAEQIQAAGRRAGRPVPWYVMTSPANDVATRGFFRRNDNFGLRGEDVFFLVQGTMPAVSFDGKLILSLKGSLALGPNGHGGSLGALRLSGALDDMAARGVELISYFQVDNPLVRCVDPLFLGLHAIRGAEMSAKCLPKHDPMEKLGNFCTIDGRVRVIEYCDLPEELALETTDDGHLRFSAGSIAIHAIGRSFVERLTAGGQSALPFHRAKKKVPYVNEAGQVVKPPQPNAVKLEMFVFDAMHLAEKTVIMETVRSEEFSPIKNADGPDSLTSSLHDQVRRAAGWLEQAGLAVPRDADGQVAAAIEISPVLADSAEELAGKVDPSLKISPGQSLYLA